MNEPQYRQQDRLIRVWATAFTYPPTPDLATPILQRLQRPRRSPAYRLAWATMLLVLVGGGLFAVPPVRAAVLEFLQIGQVRIWLNEPTPTAMPAETPATMLLDLAGETSLAEVQAAVDFPIHLPAYPSDLGSPDRIYQQQLGGSLVILVWLEPKPAAVEMSLTILGPGAMAEKQVVNVITEITVNGGRALWVTGNHPLQLQSGDFQMMRLVQGNTLIWSQDEAGHTLTYRLESNLSLAEAVRVAESLSPME